MTTEQHHITVNDIPVDVVRKNIKNLHLAVYPPDGRVRVAAPLRVNDEAVRLFTLTKMSWIKRQQAKFAQQERQAAREYISGESHYYRGRRYRLNVIYEDRPPQVKLRNKTRMDLIVRPGSDQSQREYVLQNWYRQQLKRSIQPLMDKWAGVIGVRPDEWGVKQMKTKWGTCNIQARRIWLNLELVKKPDLCLEYIIVHELVHLLERHHNDRFIALMNTYMPQWRQYRDELNQAPLAFEAWDY